MGKKKGGNKRKNNSSTKLEDLVNNSNENVGENDNDNANVDNEVKDAAPNSQNAEVSIEKVRTLDDNSKLQEKLQLCIEKSIETAKDEEQLQEKEEVTAEKNRTVDDNSKLQEKFQTCTEENMVTAKDEERLQEKKERRLEEEVRYLRYEVSELQSKHKLEEEVRELRYEISELESKVEEMGTSLKRLSVENEQLTGKVTALEQADYQARELRVTEIGQQDQISNTKDPVMLAVSEPEAFTNSMNEQRSSYKVPNIELLNLSRRNDGKMSEAPVLESYTDVKLTPKPKQLHLHTDDISIESNSNVREVLLTGEAREKSSSHIPLGGIDEVGSSHIVGTQQIMHAEEDVRTSEVPLSDAPIIGAPIRLFSFVTKYVTGADLVKSGEKSVTR